jgi:hypothetical protein
MKLTTTQIDQLYLFTRQHYVEWYDLQSELVDHLANAIESEWQENPKLTFDEVLNKEFGKFGVFGFMDVVEEKQKFLGKKYSKLIWEFYKQFFQLPKIILIIALVYGFYVFLNFFENSKNIFLGFFVSEIVIYFFLVLQNKRKLNQKEKITGKKWLFEDNATSNNVLLVFILGQNTFNFFRSVLNVDYWQNEFSIIASTILVLLSLFLYLQYKIIPKKVSEELAKTYPEYIF